MVDIFLLDVYALIYRAYFALIKKITLIFYL